MGIHHSGRRDFVKKLGSLAVGLPVLTSGLLFGCDKPTPSAAGDLPSLPGSLKKEPRVGAWLEVLEDGRIRVFSGKIELGQGIKTVIQQVAADELHADLADVEVILADTERTPDEGYTAGSGSVKNSAMAVRHASATAREYLLELAADELKVPQEELRLNQGIVSTASKKIRISIQKLLEGKELSIPSRVVKRPLAREDYRFVGRSIPRTEMLNIVQGKTTFIQDFYQKDVWHARVCRPPHYRCTLQDFDVERLEDELGGGAQIIRDGSFLAIVVKSEYQAIKMVSQVDKRLSWKNEELLGQSTSFKEDLKHLPAKEEEVSASEKLEVDSDQEVQLFEGSFYKPYLLHASLGPACAVARFNQGHLEVWSHSQGIFPLRRALSSLLEIREIDIHVRSVLGAGTFGHNSSDDAAAEAAFIAIRMPGEWIKVSWSREEENQWESMGSAMRVDVTAGLDKDGTIASWQTHVYSDSHSTRPNQDAGTLLIAHYLQKPRFMQGRGYLKGGSRNAEPYYTIPNLQIEASYFEGPLRVSSLRSLGAYGNAFAIESIVEEMAHSIDQDPIDFRIRHLDDDRAKEVLLRLQEMTQGLDVGKGEGVGYGFCRYKNNDGYCAIAAHVRVGMDNQVSILKMLAAVDVGEVMNLGGIKHQVEGAIIQAASWTMSEEVKFSNGYITSTNFDTYNISRMSLVQAIHVEVIARPDSAPHGGGEVGTPPTPAAITNAIERACGLRIYDLPVSKAMKLA